MKKIFLFMFMFVLLALSVFAIRSYPYIFDNPLYTYTIYTGVTNPTYWYDGNSATASVAQRTDTTGSVHTFNPYFNFSQGKIIKNITYYFTLYHQGDGACSYTLDIENATTNAWETIFTSGDARCTPTATINTYKEVNMSKPILSVRLSTSISSSSTSHIYQTAINEFQYTFDNQYNNSLALYLKDEPTDTLITTGTGTATFIGDDTGKIFTKTFLLNGSYYLLNFTDDNYFIQYSTPLHEIRNYFLNVSNNTNYIQTLYLINKSIDEQIVYLINDENGDPLEGVIVKAKALFISDATYKVVAECKTAFNGKCSMFLRENYPYSYVIEKDSSIKYISPFIVYDNTVAVEIPFGDTSIFDLEDVLYGINTNILYNNATHNFKYYFNVLSGTSYEFCLKLYNQTSYINRNELIHSSCVNSSSATITINHNIENESILATGDFDYNGNVIILDSGIFSDVTVGAFSKVIGKTGLLLALLIIVALTIIGATQSPASAIIMSILGIICVTWVGLIQVVWGIIAGLILLGVGIAYLTKT